ncbi:MAG TPA: acetate kinase [Microbacteriaceae bacterium]
MSSILVVNSGSSSFKYQMIDMATEQTLASGLVERIGEASGHSTHRGPDGVTERTLPIPDHTAGFAVMLDAFEQSGPSLAQHPPIAVGHRVVHGGMRFFEPTLITDLVRINIEDLSELAPLHNPANVQGIVAAQKAFPNLPHVAVFDTAFHQTLPPAAYTYAIDADVAERYRVRRYGFHGTSHKFVSEAAAAFLGRPLAELKQIVLHLGNGASACAVDGGRSVETSMGMTPLEGLVMGTRSGDIDPAVLFHLNRTAGYDIEQLDVLLNRRSGLLGLSGHGDMRDVQRAAAAGDEVAELAFEVYLHRIKQYVGAYFAQLGGLDVITFTAGVGENNALVRAGALAGLEPMGIRIDVERNESADREARIISTDASHVAVLVIPTNEELEIARQTLTVVE